MNGVPVVVCGQDSVTSTDMHCEPRLMLGGEEVSGEGHTAGHAQVFLALPVHSPREGHPCLRGMQSWTHQPQLP